MVDNNPLDANPLANSIHNVQLLLSEYDGCKILGLPLKRGASLPYQYIPLPVVEHDASTLILVRMYNTIFYSCQSIDYMNPYSRNVLMALNGYMTSKPLFGIHNESTRRLILEKNKPLHDKMILANIQYTEAVAHIIYLLTPPSGTLTNNLKQVYLTHVIYDEFGRIDADATQRIRLLGKIGMKGEREEGEDEEGEEGEHRQKLRKSLLDIKPTTMIKNLRQELRNAASANVLVDLIEEQHQIFGKEEFFKRLERIPVPFQITPRFVVNHNTGEVTMTRDGIIDIVSSSSSNDGDYELLGKGMVKEEREHNSDNNEQHPAHQTSLPDLKLTSLHALNKPIICVGVCARKDVLKSESQLRYLTNSVTLLPALLKSRTDSSYVNYDYDIGDVTVKGDYDVTSLTSSPSSAASASSAVPSVNAKNKKVILDINSPRLNVASLGGVKYPSRSLRSKDNNKNNSKQDRLEKPSSQSFPPLRSYLVPQIKKKKTNNNNNSKTIDFLTSEYIDYVTLTVVEHLDKKIKAFKDDIIQSNARVVLISMEGDIYETSIHKDNFNDFFIENIRNLVKYRTLFICNKHNRSSNTEVLKQIFLLQEEFKNWIGNIERMRSFNSAINARKTFNIIVDMFFVNPR